MPTTGYLEYTNTLYYSCNLFLYKINLQLFEKKDISWEFLQAIICYVSHSSMVIILPTQCLGKECVPSKEYKYGRTGE